MASQTTQGCLPDRPGVPAGRAPEACRTVQCLLDRLGMPAGPFGVRSRPSGGACQSVWGCLWDPFRRFGRHNASKIIPKIQNIQIPLEIINFLRKTHGAHRVIFLKKIANGVVTYFANSCSHYAQKCVVTTQKNGVQAAPF